MLATPDASAELECRRKTLLGCRPIISTQHLLLVNPH
ncbi:hypothetical protein XHC_1142 [Xanthomonas hortorum pv. carotae str. M081]|nr:hypothetical protein XHC_1142 [Xanthomonas hortorum pv. carotae str. M081]